MVRNAAILTSSLVLALCSFLGADPVICRGQSFRSGVMLVPVDVRVLDQRGRPVTDLAAADFRLFEDGVEQKIAHFAAFSHAWVGPAFAEGRVLGPPPARTFVFVLGRGQLNGTSRAIDALVDFIRTGLAQTDRIAVMAYLHCTELTTDHGAVARLLERYRERSPGIEEKLDRDSIRFVGAPSHPIQSDTQLAIQDLFSAPDLPPVRPLAGGAGGSGVPFNDFRYLVRVIDYLREIDGEKHLVAVVASASLAGRVAPVIQQLAAAARVTVSVVQAGGLDSPLPESAGAVSFFSVDHLRSQATDARALRDLATATGGVAGVYEAPAKGFERLATIASFTYVLGYYPQKPLSPGEHRDIRVTVARRGLTVLHRRVHVAHRQPTDEPSDLRTLFAEARIRQALSWSKAASSHGSQSIPMRIAARSSAGTAKAEVVVDVRMDPSRVTFTQLEGQYEARLDVAIFVRDRAEDVLGEAWARLDLSLDADSYRQTRRDWIPYRATVALHQPSDNVKGSITVVVFEYESDRVAWVTRRLQ